MAINNYIYLLIFTIYTPLSIIDICVVGDIVANNTPTRHCFIIYHSCIHYFLDTSSDYQIINFLSGGFIKLMLTRTLIKKLFSTGKKAVEKQTVVLFPGHGIGPEISEAVIRIFQSAHVPIEFQHHEIHLTRQTVEGDLISNETLDALRKYKYGLKGPFETPIGKGIRSLNVTLRKKLQLYANVRPCKSIEGVDTPYQNVDIVTIRENTEGEYSGLEHEVRPGIVENLKIISRNACQNIAEYAFEYARKFNRKQVMACHKAGVMKMGDGLFIKVTAEFAKKYPEIEYKEDQVDTICERLANNPNQLDVMVMPNLYGDIVSDLCAGLIGGLGLTASGNIGKTVEVYEAVHGSAPDIAGRGVANPTALLLSGTMMLKSMGLKEHADRIETATFKVLKERKVTTGDLGGKSTTKQFTNAIISNLDQ